MLNIETAGTWYDMGRQFGEALADDLSRCVARFTGLLGRTRDDVGPATAAVRALIQQQCPELLEETAGMAVGADIPERDLLTLRFYGAVANWMPPGCSAFFVLDADDRPWLARTCDIEPEDHWHQTCQLRRPDTGYATITTTYLGFAGAVGINEHGLGIVGVSAGTRESYGDTGVLSSVLLHRVLTECRDFEEANELILNGPVLGKGCVWLVADANGTSALVQVAPGRRPHPIPRPPGQRWQACTNFQPCSLIPGLANPVGLYNSYARYGWLAHQLGDGYAGLTAEGLQDVLRGVSQPGPNIPGGSFPLETAYATLFDLTTRTAYVAGGNPNAVPFDQRALR